MKKDVFFEWDEAFSNAFNSIKIYLLNPPVLRAPIHGQPFVFYLAAQENKERKENAFYYLSKTLNGAKLNYTPIEKTYLALMFTIKKRRHYLQSHSIRFISRADPIKIHHV